jgi:hypothetical protein
LTRFPVSPRNCSWPVASAREFEEALVVLRQGVGRNRLEGIAKAGARGFQHGLAFGEQGTFAFQLALQRGAAYRQRRLFIAQGGELGFALHQ